MRYRFLRNATIDGQFFRRGACVDADTLFEDYGVDADYVAELLARGILILEES